MKLLVNFEWLQFLLSVRQIGGTKILQEEVVPWKIS